MANGYKKSYLTSICLLSELNIYLPIDLPGELSRVSGNEELAVKPIACRR